MSLYKGINANTGEEVIFKREWGQKTFTDEECRKLANGEEISFPYESRTGQKFPSLIGKLMPQTDEEGNSHLTFTPAFVYDCPPGYCGVTFSEQEKDVLKSGGTIRRKDFISRKSGRTFAANLHLENGSIVAQFDKTPSKIKLDPKLEENNKPMAKNTFADDLFKASNDGLSPAEVEENRIAEANTPPSLLSGKVKGLKNVKLLHARESGPDTYTLFYSNGVMVIIAKSDYTNYKDLIELSSIDEVIKEYAIEVDASSIVGGGDNSNKNNNRFEF